MSETRKFGVCYYPEHWPESGWAEDAAQMRDIGLSIVRIGEFAWSRIEPSPGKFDWGWLDRAIDTLGAAGLEIMLGTPTATPPKWLIDRHPDILASDAQGRPRRFGSRRHYCFSSETYRRESARIVEAVAKRYGQHEAITSWQTDNEYGCHDTVRSYSDAAAAAFRRWLEARYAIVEALNTAWGCVFWSQEYASFEQVDLPNLTVTEPNPSHVLDFYRFSSDQVVSYNRLQTDILRKHSPGRGIVHNYMGFYFNFDHFAVAEDLDAVGWDSYPLGFLNVGPYEESDQRRYMRQGHPDFAGFFHDLYRGTGRGRFSVLEQQPGPVNWAYDNPAPLPGMVRLWSHEALSHGAEMVNYFRWRQAPFAQEQMHAGLQRPDRSLALGAEEAKQAAAEWAKIAPNTARQKARVALAFSYDAHWLFEAQPQGAGWSYTGLVMDWYSALRRLGQDVDIVSPQQSLDGYALVLVPSLPVLGEAFVETVKACEAQVLFGPRTGSKTQNMTIPDGLAPGALKSLIPVEITHSESFPEWHEESGLFEGLPVSGEVWLDHVSSALEPTVKTDTGAGLYYRHGRVSYLTTVPKTGFLDTLLSRLLEQAGLTSIPLPDGVRIRSAGEIVFAFNYNATSVSLPEGLCPPDGLFVLGGKDMPPAGVTAWKR
ncbi:MAG: beta-galactosidase [Henriciella sp.]